MCMKNWGCEWLSESHSCWEHWFITLWQEFLVLRWPINITKKLEFQDCCSFISEVLEFGMYHNESLPEGLQQVADSLTPKFTVTFTILFTLCGLSCVVLLNHNGFFAPDWVRSKPSIALAGKFSIIMTALCPVMDVFAQLPRHVNGNYLPSFCCRKLFTEF